MVAKALNIRQQQRPNIDAEVDGLTTTREKIFRQLEPLLERLKNRWVILGIFVLTYVPFGVMYMGAFQDHRALQTQIEAQRSVLALPEPRTDDIEIGLASWTSAFEAARGQQVLELPDSDLLERLLSTAISTGVVIRNATTGENSVAEVGAESYETTPIVLQLAGSLPNLEAFIAAIEADAIEALEVQNARISLQESSYGASVRAIVFNRPLSEAELEALKNPGKKGPAVATKQDIDSGLRGGSQ
jgi:hypothetical protein